MENVIINELSTTLNLKVNQVEAVLKLLSEGSTIPFIARYRKEATGNLNEDQIRQIEEVYKYQENLLNRKNDVIRLIEEKGMLTDEIKVNVMACGKLTEIEDIYRPYKEKKKTKATEAIKMGLEPLAKMIMVFPVSGTFADLCKSFDMEESRALENAGYIIAEWISDNAFYRKWIRQFIFNNGEIGSKVKKNVVDEKEVYEMYYDFKDRVKYIKHFRVLALNRGENEKILTVGIDVDMVRIEEYLFSKIIRNDKSFVCEYVKNCVRDALKRLIMPSVEREVRSELTLQAEELAINTFAVNLENLLLTRPIKKSIVMGFDPAFRTGCKLAIMDEVGNVLHIATIFPHEPVNDKIGSMKVLLELIDKYNIDLIAIGNGTASRESEAFVAECIKGKDVKYIIVSEAGASVYSASELAKAEFPELTVEKRSAVSIGRRVQDPLSELVKIDPKSIGVGEYQHDINQKELTESLDFTVSKVVNKVGVNINTASKSILKYISGLSKSVIEKLTDYKSKKEIISREEIKNIKGISDKVYEQAIGFLRVSGSDNIFDITGIHPESYVLAEMLLSKLGLNIKEIYTVEFKKVLENADIKKLAEEVKADIYTVEDIIKELKNPGLDPRDSLEAPLLKSDILTIENLTIGMELQGTVRNVASFGAFVDIGLKNDGLVHISKMSREFVKDPNDVVNVGDIVTVIVDGIDLEKNKVSLSFIK